MSTLSFQAMFFARQIHSEQRRKYSGNLYADHLAEVAGIVSVVSDSHPNAAVTIATAWLHDSREDQGITDKEISERFGSEVALGVALLSDLEEGNRATRKEAARVRLSKAPAWVQDIKVADLISNTSSIVMHDPNFAVVYLKEKRLLLDVLTKANPGLLEIAKAQI